MERNDVTGASSVSLQRGDYWLGWRMAWDKRGRRDRMVESSGVGDSGIWRDWLEKVARRRNDLEKIV